MKKNISTVAFTPKRERAFERQMRTQAFIKYKIAFHQ